MRHVIGLGIGTGLLCAAGFFLATAQNPQDKSSGDTWETRQAGDLAKIPGYAWQALSSPYARKANLWASSKGFWTRYSVHVDRMAIPDWAHAMADAKLGRGVDLDYEVERYPDGAEVYEIYRTVDGREKQLSVKADRTIYYVGTEQDAKVLPAPVTAAIRDLKDFVVEQCILKESAELAEYHLKGTLQSRPCRVRVSRDGKLIAVQRRIPAEIEVPVKP